MKTLKVILIAAIVSVAFMSYAEQPVQSTVKENTVKITLKQALTIHELVLEMHQQLTPDFLKLEHPGLYDATVHYKKLSFKIIGTRGAWLEFFRSKVE